MAAKYRKIDPRIWTDEGFSELDTVQKLVALYCITAQSNRCGIFSFSMARAAEEIGIDRDSYAIAMSKVCNSLRWKYDDRRKVLYLPTWWKYNNPENEKHLKGCVTDIRDLPQTELIKEFAANEKFVPSEYLDAFRIAIGIAMGIGMPYQKQEQEQEQEQEFSPPPDEEEGVPAKPTKPRKKRTDAHAILTETYVLGWEAKYKEKCVFTGRDASHIKWILKHCDENLTKAQALVRAYLEDADRWIEERAHPLGNLVSQFNKYRAVKPSPVQHDPSAALGLAETRDPNEQDIALIQEPRK